MVDNRLAVDVIQPFLEKAPVNVAAMAAELGVKVEYDFLEPGVSGKIECSLFEDHCTITVNMTHPETRQRFTIAHELAHYILHRDLIGDGVIDNAMYRSERLSDERERQANRYAAQLLMPKKLVRRAWDDGARTREALAALFKVSPEVAEIRMRELGTALW